VITPRERSMSSEYTPVSLSRFRDVWSSVKELW
jgi:hypothetical protein